MVLFCTVDDMLVDVTTGFPGARLIVPLPLRAKIFLHNQMSHAMIDIAILLLLRPFVLLLFFGVLVIPIELAFMRWFPAGKIKTFLLRKI